MIIGIFSHTDASWPPAKETVRPLVIRRYHRAFAVGGPLSTPLAGWRHAALLATFFTGCAGLTGCAGPAQRAPAQLAQAMPAAFDHASHSGQTPCLQCHLLADAATGRLNRPGANQHAPCD